MNKKKIIALVLGAALIGGVAFNAASVATYVENLGTATQIINAASWDVDLGGGFGEHTIFPGDAVSNDIVTLTNNNEYAVKFTVKLDTEGITEKGTDFDKALTLDLKKDGVTTGIPRPDGSVDFIVNAGKSVALNSYVYWKSSDKDNEDIKHQGQGVKYNYNITSEALTINALDTWYTVSNSVGGLRLKNLNNNASSNHDAIKLSSATGNLTTSSTGKAVSYKYKGEANTVKLTYAEGQLKATVNGIDCTYAYASAPETINTALFVLNRGGKGPMRVDSVKVNGAEFAGGLTNTKGGEMFFDVPVEYVNKGYEIEFNLYLDGAQSEYGQNENGKIEVRVGTKN